MPTYNPERNYPPHEQDNPYYVNQFGYLQRPSPVTMAGVADAVANECKAKLDQACDALASTRGPRKFNQKQYDKQHPPTVFNHLQKKNAHIRVKCGPSYFPVN